MNVSIEPIMIEQKPVFVQLMELYSYDFSEYSGEDVSEYGYFGYPHIDDYWNEPGRYPFFIRVDGKLAGLALVRSCCEYAQLAHPHCMAEFFVMRKYRRRGVGRIAAGMVFDRFPGGWEVSQWRSNLPAQRFWQRVISGYTHGRYDAFDCAEQDVVGFTFDNSD
ncbi:MAG: GNAT family N-acetyltransferase [Clostridia bacterium]|nr:GNAT family N-acetyltransferase [Clostridia bacterium]